MSLISIAKGIAFLFGILFILLGFFLFQDAKNYRIHREELVGFISFAAGLLLLYLAGTL